MTSFLSDMFLNVTHNNQGNAKQNNNKSIFDIISHRNQFPLHCQDRNIQIENPNPNMKATKKDDQKPPEIQTRESQLNFRNSEAQSMSLLIQIENIVPNFVDQKQENKKKVQNITIKQKKYTEEKLQEFISDKENSKLLTIYGDKCLKFNKLLDTMVFNIPSSLLTRHNIRPSLRTKMVDWIIEVLSVFKQTDETYFLTVMIMDLFFAKTKFVLKNENVYLIGVASIFIASKFEEYYPITMETLLDKIAHNQFSATQIKKTEIKICKDIDFASLVSTSMLDFIKTYLFDFQANNENYLEYTNRMKILKMIKKTSVHLAKILLYYEHFYEYNAFVKSIACIHASIRILQEKCEDVFDEDTVMFYNQWKNFLVLSNGADAETVENAALEIYSAFLNYYSDGNPFRNLIKFNCINFLC